LGSELGAGQIEALLWLTGLAHALAGRPYLHLPDTGPIGEGHRAGAKLLGGEQPIMLARPWRPGFEA
jgi:hypothetical protein